MYPIILDETKTTRSKAAYFIATIAVIGCVAGVIAAYNYHQTPATTLIYSKTDLNPTTMWDLFTQWKIANNKIYENAEEEKKRFETFQNNYVFILNHNADPTQGSTVGLNLYADLSSEEFSHFKNCFNATQDESIKKNYGELDATDIPNEVDWRTAGAVTPVKNQGQCGSCWSFSTTGSLEGLNFIKNGNLLSFSEQQLVDCSSSYGNNGCNGGLMDYAFKYVAKKGIELESIYPYTAKDGTCEYSPSKTEFKNTGYTDVPAKNSEQLTTAVAKQPVSVAIEADQSVFQLYTGGVINSKSCGTSLDHGVLVVGYNNNPSNGKPYWIVKNSWGASWGEQGYVRIAKTSDEGPGICGIAMSPSYPTA